MTPAGKSLVSVVLAIDAVASTALQIVRVVERRVKLARPEIVTWIIIILLLSVLLIPSVHFVQVPLLSRNSLEWCRMSGAAG